MTRCCDNRSTEQGCSPLVCTASPSLLWGYTCSGTPTLDHPELSSCAIVQSPSACLHMDCASGCMHSVGACRRPVRPGEQQAQEPGDHLLSGFLLLTELSVCLKTLIKVCPIVSDCFVPRSFRDGPRTEGRLQISSKWSLCFLLVLALTLLPEEPEQRKVDEQASQPWLWLPTCPRRQKEDGPAGDHTPSIPGDPWAGEMWSITGRFWEVILYRT